MPKVKNGIAFEGWEELFAKLDSISNGTAVRGATEQGLQKVQESTTKVLQKKTANASLPAKGKYSTGRTRASIYTDKSVTWDGTTANINAGFEFAKSGLTSIMLIHGTPKMKPVAGLKAEFYGAKACKRRADEISEVIRQRIDEIMGGR